jgi:hypothetical protein
VRRPRVRRGAVSGRLVCEILNLWDDDLSRWHGATQPGLGQRRTPSSPMSTALFAINLLKRHRMIIVDGDRRWRLKGPQRYESVQPAGEPRCRLAVESAESDSAVQRKVARVFRPGKLPLTGGRGRSPRAAGPRSVSEGRVMWCKFANDVRRPGRKDGLSRTKENEQQLRQIEAGGEKRCCGQN